jgi:plasmid stability protein
MNQSDQLAAIAEIVADYLAEVFEETHEHYLAEVDDPENWTRCCTHEAIAEWEARDGLTSLLVWEQVAATAAMDYADVEAMVRPILRKLWVADQMRALDALRESLRTIDNA